ncbi:MAG: alpha-amylase family glycosyl hydrolase [Chitinophagaceae bacterium]
MKYLLGLLIPLMIAGCSKSGHLPPITPPTAYTDSLPPQFGTPFTEVPDPKDIIMYEVNIRAFSTQHNFNGIIGRLDSIKALGINVIWLMPIYPVGKLNALAPMGSPYSVQNYQEVNPDFGSLANLQFFVSAAHSRGMSVILDWVADHSSWDNPWIANKSWYLQDPDGNIISPPGTNWKDVAALNYSNLDMRHAMINAMKYWILAANIDGYRCDYADGPPLDFWQQAFDSLQIMVPQHKLILLAESANKSLFSTGFQLNYAWDYYTALKNAFENSQPASSIIATDIAENTGLPGNDFKLRFTSNHDEDLNDNTPIALFNGQQGSMAAFVLASYMGGIPLIYDGQEVGDPEKIPIFDTSSIDWSNHPEMTLAYKKLLAFRNLNDAVKEGSLISYSNADVAAFTRTSGTAQVLVAVNIRDSSVTYTWDPALANTSWKDAMNNDSMVQLANQISLSPYEYRILEKN